MISPDRIGLPLFGGTLIPAPTILIPFVTGSDGGSIFGLFWPTGTPVGTKFYTQAWMLETLGPIGVSASNAIEATQMF